MTGAQPNALARTLRQFFADHLPGIAVAVNGMTATAMP